MVAYREDTCTKASVKMAVGKKQILCCGRPEEPCRFHREGSGKAAWASKHSATQKCIFCDATALREVHLVAPATITRALNNLRAESAELHGVARTRKQETLESLEALFWVSSLQDRVCHLSLSEAEIQEGAKARQNDTKRACRKFPTLYEEHAKHVDWQTSAAKTFQKWAEEASWTTCPECKRLRTQRFPTGSRPRCRYCVNGTGYFAPSPADVPVELRGMSRCVLECLRPFSISCGPGEPSPSGYWARLDSDGRALKLCRFCTFSSSSSLSLWSIAVLFIRRLSCDLANVSDIVVFQYKCGRPAGRALDAHCLHEPQRHEIRRRFLLCVLMLLQGHHVRLLQLSEFFVCRLFIFEEILARDFGLLAVTLHLETSDGSVDLELTQFVYDLWLYTGIGSADRATGLSLRAALAGKSFAPEYWRTKHAALVDLQKQLGPPTLFITIAPYEWTAPYHAWLIDEMCKATRSRTNLPVAVSLHLAHILTEVVRGLLTVPPT